jgi:iron complex transport system substrate-binding protein
MVMVDLWEDPLMVAGPGSFVDEMIHLAGGRNVAFDAKKNWATFSVEAVVARKPAVIIRAFMGSDAENAAAKLRDWAAMPGLEKARIYGPDDIAPDLLLQPGVRTVDALEKLAAILHPELFRAPG